jgi:uncharacterized protein (DUF302 family)
VFEAIRVGSAAAELDEVLEIDHARLAAQAGASMPPARVLLISDAEIVSRLLDGHPRAGLDLPFRVLAYEGTDGPAVAYTDDAFLRVRHGLDNAEALAAFDRALDGVLARIEVPTQAVPVEGLTRDQGIVELVSDHGYRDTIDRLKQAVMGQDDTVWFGEINYAAEAREVGRKLQPATLLLFGGPAPGGVAMAEYPRLGLDAFCQKLLVYEDDSGQVRVLFNSIAALAQLHYGEAAKPHRMLDKRLSETFAAAIARP